MLTSKATTREKPRQRSEPWAASPLSCASSSPESSSVSSTPPLPIARGGIAKLPRSTGGNCKKSPLKTVPKPPKTRRSCRVACWTRTFDWCN